MSLRHCYLLLFCSLASAQTVSFLPPVIAFTSGYSEGDTICSTCLAVADFNGDGKPDIAYAIFSPLPIAGVLLGNGDGTFQSTVQFPYNQADGSPFAADFNGDGNTDVLISGDTTWLFPGTGNGFFAPPIPVPCSSMVSPSVSVVADFNRDGKPDLLCGTTVLLGNGDGTFHTAGTAGTLPGGLFVLSADFNNDGNPDLLLRELSGLLAVVLGHGDGTFGPELLISGPTENGELSTTLIAGDFNSDGNIDLAGYSYMNLAIDVLPGNGDGTFRAPIQTNLTSGPPGPFTAAADFNKDGKLDLIAGDAVLAGNGDGTFRFPVFFGPIPEPCGAAVSPSAPPPCGYTHLATAVADFNGDGLPDIVTGSIVQAIENKTVSPVTVLLNDSPGDGFTATGVSPITATWPVGTGSIVSAFGINLAPSTEAAAVNPAPTTLGGIRLHVRDRSHTTDYLSPLLYVSPTQINYLLTSTDPYAWIAIERVGTPYVPKGISVPITSLAPGLFFIGPNLAAASAVRVTPYAQTEIPVISCSLLTCTAIPIDLSSGSVYLSLYGTGFAQASTPASTCTIAGQTLPLTYAGPEIAIAGLDQVNLLLPQSLAGTGATTVSCSFETAGQVSGVTNTANLAIQ